MRGEIARAKLGKAKGMAILAVNAGSSSLKFSVHPLRDGALQSRVLTGTVQGLEPGGFPVLDWTYQGQKHSQQLPAGASSFEQALRSLTDLLDRHDLPELCAVAHRVVHGGSAFSASVVVTDDVLSKLASLNALAPLHQPHNLQGIRAFAKAFPTLPQIACFDTAFHATLPPVEYGFALPAEVTDMGVRRYGFHGLSYQYVMSILQQFSPQAQGRVLMAHLGNGASLCGAVHGRSRATTMGFSALDGLMMGTRSGALDAGVLLYLLERGWDHERLQTLLYKQSGLLGVSGISADMRRLRSDGGPAAQRAVDMFTYRVVREAGALAACLGGLDVLAFSGGIGEHDAVLRAEVVGHLSWLGIKLDPARNEKAVGNEVVAIHQAGSRVEVWVVPTDEGQVAAQEAAALLTLR